MSIKEALDQIRTAFPDLEWDTAEVMDNGWDHSETRVMRNPCPA